MGAKADRPKIDTSREIFYGRFNLIFLPRRHLNPRNTLRKTPLNTKFDFDAGLPLPE